MADVTGPISTLPGSYHPVPAGMMCDDHPDVPAFKRIQGETDSFGSEMWDCCKECYNKYLADKTAVDPEELKFCEWCKTRAKYVHPTRDFEEGSCGRLYDVCADCRAKQTAAIHEELDEYTNFCYDYNDYD